MKSCYARGLLKKAQAMLRDPVAFANLLRRLHIPAGLTSRLRRIGVGDTHSVKADRFLSELGEQNSNLADYIRKLFSNEGLNPRQFKFIGFDTDITHGSHLAPRSFGRAMHGTETGDFISEIPGMVKNPFGAIRSSKRLFAGDKKTLSEYGITSPVTGFLNDKYILRDRRGAPLMIEDTPLSKLVEKGLSKRVADIESHGVASSISSGPASGMRNTNSVGTGRTVRSYLLDRGLASPARVPEVVRASEGAVDDLTHLRIAFPLNYVDGMSPRWDAGGGMLFSHTGSSGGKAFKPHIDPGTLQSTQDVAYDSIMKYIDNAMHKKASSSHPDARELAKSIRDRVKYGLRYSDGSYETSPDMWEKRDARDIVVQTPEELDASGIGMCHDVTRTLVKKLRENRIRHRAVMLKGDHVPNLPTHSFIVSKRDGKYDVLDPLSYDEGYRGGFDSFNDAVAGRIDDWRKEDEKGNVTTEPIRKRDWSRRPLLDFLRYGYEKKAEYRLKDNPTYGDAASVFNRLSFADRANIAPRHPDYLRDVPKDMLFDRQVAVDENGNPVGFNEFYYGKDRKGRRQPPHNSMGVVPEARGNGLSKLMVEAAIRKAKKEKIKRLVWEAFADNEPSIRAALSAGFEDATPKNAKEYRRFVYSVPVEKKASSLDLKKLFPSSKFPTEDELKEKEKSFSVGDRVKVSDHIRCRQKGHVGTIVRIDPENKHGWKSFIVKFDDKKYGSMGFSSGNIDKVAEKKASFLSFFKRSKPVAKAIVPSAGGRLAAAKNALRAEMSARLGMKRLSALIPEMEQIRERGLKGDAFVSAARELGISRVQPVVESTRDAIVRRLYEIAKRHSFDTDWKGTYSRVSRFGARTARDNPERVLEEVSRALRTESGRELGDNLRAAFEHGWKYTGSPRYDAGVDELLSWMPVKKASSKKETYESGEGEVESYTSDKTKDHDEIVIRTKDGRRIRISNNTRLGKRLGAKKGNRVNYNGYRVRGTDVVHKVHPNAHQRGGWLEHEKAAEDKTGGKEKTKDKSGKKELERRERRRRILRRAIIASIGAGALAAPAYFAGRLRRAGDEVTRIHDETDPHLSLRQLSKELNRQGHLPKTKVYPLGLGPLSVVMPRLGGKVPVYAKKYDGGEMNAVAVVNYDPKNPRPGFNRPRVYSLTTHPKILMHELGHCVDYMNGTYINENLEKRKSRLKEAILTVVAPSRTTNMQNEIRAWDNAKVDKSDPLRRAALGTYFAGQKMNLAKDLQGPVALSSALALGYDVKRGKKKRKKEEDDVEGEKKADKG